MTRAARRTQRTKGLAKAGLKRARRDDRIEKLQRDYREALDREGATSEILRIIATSPTNKDAAFEAITRAGTRLIAGTRVSLMLVRDGMLDYAAHSGISAAQRAAMARIFPTPLDRLSVATSAILGKRVVNVADIRRAGRRYRRSLETASIAGWRAILSVPLLKRNEAIGTINVSRASPGAFTKRQVALVKTFADQAVIAVENARLFNETTEALDRQTATAEILRVISSSPADLAPVFDAILKSATELCEANLGILNLYDGEKSRTVAHRGATGEFAKWLVARGPFKPQSLMVRMLNERRPVHVNDVSESEEYRSGSSNIVKFVELGGVRSFLLVPLLKADRVLGSVAIYRREVRPFSDKQIALLTTFANQAVIAIENVRLFNETKEALERQTATADILHVISTAPTDLQPVFDKIAHTAMRMLDAFSAAVTRREQDTLNLVAYTSTDQQGDAFIKRIFPIPLSDPHRPNAVVVRTKAPFHIPDSEAPGVPREARDLARARGWRANLVVPMIREDEAIGAISVTRRQPGAFSQNDISLLKTFASQAVIAIENARLFNDTKEALERQTATAEILKVISSSTRDTQPVFQAIVRSAARLFPMSNATLFMRDGELIRLCAFDGETVVGDDMRKQLASIYPIAFNPEVSTSARAMVERQTNICLDTEAPDVPEHIRRAGRAGRFRSNTVVPLVRGDEGIGTIVITHAQPGHRLNEEQLALLRTFADQAVIAIENVRLFKELEVRNKDLGESLEQQTATAEILQVISSSVADSQPVFERILQSCERLFGGSQLVIFVLGDDGLLHVGAARGPKSGEVHKLFPVPVAGTATEIVLNERRAVTYANALDDPQVPAGLRGIARRFGEPYSIALAPMLWEERGIGSILVSREKLEAFSEKEMTLLRTFADQAVIAIQNARLFREIREKSAQLEVANKHKSEFLANMSHELRTPLNAVIGFSEVLMERMFGEVNDKQAEYLKDIHESGRHLLSLINDILDLSKIEAGRMELELSTFHLPSALSNAMTLVRERAQRHGVQLGADIDPRLAEVQADERKVKQILLNLLSNAVKFTPDGGRVELSAKLDTDKVEIAVRDTGVGIAPEDQAALFEEFRQFGADAARKAEGTGLGLALTKKFVELHGGAIRVESAPGKGSTFSFSLPLAAAARSASSG